MSKPKIIQDIENIEDKIDVLSAEVEQEKEGNAVHLAEDATLSKKGHVQLSNATNSTSNALAATPSAVKSAMDRANEAFLLGNSTKEQLVDTLLSLDPSLPISYTSTWQEVLTTSGQISTGKKWANGFRSTVNNGMLIVDTLLFKPSNIIWWSQSGLFYGTYVEESTIPNYLVRGHTNSSLSQSALKTSAIITDTGFTIKTHNVNVADVGWIAYEGGI